MDYIMDYITDYNEDYIKFSHFQTEYFRPITNISHITVLPEPAIFI